MYLRILSITYVVYLFQTWETNQIRSMNASELINLTKGLSELKLKPEKLSSTFMPMFTDKTLATIVRLNSHYLASAGYICMKLKFLPNQHFVKLWREHTLVKMETYGAKELHFSLVAAVYFGEPRLVL